MDLTFKALRIPALIHFKTNTGCTNLANNSARFAADSQSIFLSFFSFLSSLPLESAKHMVLRNKCCSQTRWWYACALCFWQRFANGICRESEIIMTLLSVKRKTIQNEKFDWQNLFPSTLSSVLCIGISVKSICAHQKFWIIRFPYTANTAFFTVFAPN